MKIELQNIAKIQSAACDINGLTVIVGDNNAGKSTMGRALFSVFHSLQDLETKIYRTKNRLVFSDTSYSWTVTLGADNIAKLTPEELKIAENKGWVVV